LSVIEAAGALRKMRTELSAPVNYQLLVGEAAIPLNPQLGTTIRLQYLGAITCNHCGRKTKKSFSQGYCYPCFQSLAQCDSCIVSPEKCHYFEGTCREPEWADNHCMQPHVVYLANSSGIKVGITRGNQVPTRWIDQGAVQALPILAVQTRQQSGFVEMLFKKHVADKTNWRAMLKGQVDVLDLAAQRDVLLDTCATEIAELQQRFGLQAIQLLPAAEAVVIDYPVLEHPSKVSSLDFDKTPLIEGRLLGIKGQYLMLDTGVLNIRKFGAYHVQFNAG
jgi:hypothetical protein